MLMKKFVKGPDTCSGGVSRIEPFQLLTAV